MPQPPTFITLHWSYPLSHQSFEGCTIISSRFPYQECWLGPGIHGTRGQQLVVPVGEAATAHTLGHHVASLLLYMLKEFGLNKFMTMKLWRSGMESHFSCSLPSPHLMLSFLVDHPIHQMEVPLPPSLTPHS
jgi:hypothetical protein